MLELLRWRESALAFKHDPKTCPPADRVRIQALLGGAENALNKPIDKKEELKSQVDEFRRELGKK